MVFSWPIVAVGYVLMGFGLNPVSSVALTYITDSYTEVSMPFPLSSQTNSCSDRGRFISRRYVHAKHHQHCSSVCF